jgi:hypothetical protein
MAKQRRSIIHNYAAVRAGLRAGSRMARDDVPDEELDDRDVTLSGEHQRNLMAYCRGAGLPSDNVDEIGRFLTQRKDEAAEAEDGNNQTDGEVEPLRTFAGEDDDNEELKAERKRNGQDLSPGPGGGGIQTAGFPRTKAAADVAFDKRFPDAARIRNLGGSEPQKRPAPSASGKRSGPSFDEMFPDAARIRTMR